MSSSRHEGRDGSRSFTWYELLGMVIPIASGISAAVLSTADAQLQILLILTGVGIALVIALITQVDRFRTGMSERITRLEEDILPVVKNLERLPELDDDVRKLVDAAGAAKREHSRFIYEQIIRSLAESRRSVEEIRGGVFRCRNRVEELELLDDALATSTQRVRAVAALGLDAWRQPGWSEYFSRYGKHASENPSVRHTRYFLAAKTQLDDAGLRSLLDQQRAAGIDVKVVDRDAIAPELREAVVLFDRSLLMLHVDRNAVDGIVEVSFTDDAAKIKDASTRLDALGDLVRDFPEKYLLWSPDRQRGADAVAGEAKT